MPLCVFNVILYSHQNDNRKDPFHLPSISWGPPPQISQRIRRRCLEFVAPHLKFLCVAPAGPLVIPAPPPFFQTLYIFVPLHLTPSNSYSL